MAGDRQIRKALERANREIQSRKTDRSRPDSIADVFRRCSPHLDPPAHLGPYVERLESAVREGDVEFCFAAPPQHGKSETAKHALLYYDWQHPGKRHAYATYNADQAIKIRNEVQKMAFRAGLGPHASGQMLSLDSGTEIQFVGRGGGLTGKPIDGILIVDDVLKDRAEANSMTIRETCWEWFTDVATTRRHPGSSVLVMMTRWSVDDLSGRLIQRFNWPYVRLAAECDAEDDPCGRQIGQALWEARRPVEWLQQFKRSPLTWASMYQGHPRPVGDALFQEPAWYDPAMLPRSKVRHVWGADLAYTAKTRADWSVLLGGVVHDGSLYLVDELRQQVQADVFTGRMAAKVRARPGPVLWYGNTIERGMAPLIREQIPTFQCRLAATDKYVRAVPTAEQLWNQNPGRVLLPTGAPWTAEFVYNVTNFTGEDGGLDDQVDALAACGDLALGLIRGAGGAAGLNDAIRRKWRGGLALVG